MSKTWIVVGPGSNTQKTYEEAELTAKKMVAKNGSDYFIYGLEAQATSPIPDVVVTKLS